MGRHHWSAPDRVERNAELKKIFDLARLGRYRISEWQERLHQLVRLGEQMCEYRLARADDLALWQRILDAAAHLLKIYQRAIAIAIVHQDPAGMFEHDRIDVHQERVDEPRCMQRRILSLIHI